MSALFQAPPQFPGGGGGIAPPQPPPGVVPPSALSPPSINWDAVDFSTVPVDIALDSKTETRIMTFLRSEIDRSHRFYDKLRKEWKKDREQYEEHRKPKYFPWEDCSNVTVSLTQPHVNQTVGRNVRVLRGTYPLVWVDPVPGIEPELANPDLMKGLRDLIQAKMVDDKRFFAGIVEWVTEATIVGTGIGKLYWENSERVIKKFKFEENVETNEITPYVAEESVSEWEGVTLDIVRIEDFLLPPEATIKPFGISQGQWCAQRYRERYGDALAKGAEGIYRSAIVRDLQGEADQSNTGSSTFVDQDELQRMGVVEAPEDESANELILYEVWARFDVDGDGKERECKFVYSHKHDALLAATFNPYFHGKRPFVSLPYWRIPNAFYGIGIPRQLRHPQKASNDILNAAIDALTLANTPVIVSAKQSGMKPGKNDRIWPGRWLTLDEPDTFRELRFSGPSPETMNLIQLNDQMGQRSSGVSDMLVGQESSSGNRESAQGALARQGNASPMFDLVLDNIRDAIEELSELFIATYQQWRPKGDEYLADAEFGGLIKQAFAFPTLSLIGKYRFSVMATSVSANAEIRKQTLQNLMAAMQPITQQIIGTVSQLVSPGVPPPVAEVLKQSLHTHLVLARQMVQSFELPSVDSVIPTWEDFWPMIEGQIVAARQQAEQSPQPFDKTEFRKIGPNFVELDAQEQIEVLNRAGVQPSPARIERAKRDAASVQTASAGPVGPAGAAPAPPGMPFVPPFPQ